MSSIAIIDQYEILFLVQNTKVFASKTHSPFIQWSPDALLEGQ